MDSLHGRGVWGPPTGRRLRGQVGGQGSLLTASVRRGQMRETRLSYDFLLCLVDFED